LRLGLRTHGPLLPGMQNVETVSTSHLSKASPSSSSTQPTPLPPPYADSGPQVLTFLSQTVHKKPNHHEIVITGDADLTEQYVVMVRSLGSGDIFEKRIMPSDVPSFTDPPHLHSLSQLFKVMEAGILAEAGEPTSGAVQCVSCEEQYADPNDKVYAFTFTVTQFVGSFEVVMKLPLKSAAALETRFDIKLAELETEFGHQVAELQTGFEKQIGQLQHQLRLMQLQMNRRVFFGVNHSVHVDCVKLVMATHPPDLIQALTLVAQGHHVTIAPKGASVASVEAVKRAFCAIETEWIPPVPSPALMPLQLCMKLSTLSVSGPDITDLEFLANLPKLAEITVDKSQVRDLAPLSTLPSLSILRLTNLNLEGGAEIDLSCLAVSQTLTEVHFTGSSSIGNIAPLAGVPTLRMLDVTNCARVTDRRAFISNPGLKVVPE